MTPRQNRIAYQCWWLIETTGGDCTLADMAALTGASKAQCRAICAVRGWSTRYRRVSSHAADAVYDRDGLATIDISQDIADAA